MTAPVEEDGGFVFRVRKNGHSSGFIAEAKRATEPFEAEWAIAEPYHHDVWFQFAPSPEEALSQLKAGVFALPSLILHS